MAERARTGLRWSLLALSLSACQGEGAIEVGEPMTAEAEAEPAPAMAAEAEAWIGVVVAAKVVEVEPAFVAEIEEVFVSQGDQVAAGRELARLDGRRLQEALNIAEAELRSYRAQLASARIDEEQRRRDSDRLAELAADGHVSGESLANAEFDARRAETDVTQAAAALAEARARVDGLEARLDDLSIVAPFASLVAERYLDDGAITGPGDPIVRLIAGDAAWIRFAAPPTSGIELGDEVEIEVEGGRYRGWVRSIAPQLDVAAGLRFIDAETERPFESLAIGTPARVRPRHQ